MPTDRRIYVLTDDELAVHTAEAERRGAEEALREAADAWLREGPFDVTRWLLDRADQIK